MFVKVTGTGKLNKGIFKLVCKLNFMKTIFSNYLIEKVNKFVSILLGTLCGGYCFIAFFCYLFKNC